MFLSSAQKSYYCSIAPRVSKRRIDRDLFKKSRKSERGGKLSHSCSFLLLPLLALSPIFAAISIVLATSAAAAGSGNGYGGAVSSLPGDGTSILSARNIGYRGGDLMSSIRHGWISVTVPPGSTSHQVQCIVVLNEQNDASPAGLSSTSDEIVAFSVLAERSGKPDRSVYPMEVSYTGPQITGGSHIGVLRADNLIQVIPSRVTGNHITFRSSPNRTFVVVGH